MKQVYLKCRSLFITLVMLCVSTAMFAENEAVNIDGVYYNLQNGWNYYYYDSNGNWTGSQWYERAAIVTYEPGLEPWNSGSFETYQGDIVIPDKVSYNGVDYPVLSINSYAFANCRALTSVSLPSSLVIIESDAFRYTSISSLTIPKSVQQISNSAFNNTQFSSFSVDASNEKYTSKDGVIYNKDITNIVAFPAKKGGTYAIPSTITSIGSRVFPGGVSLDELIIPNNVTKIDNYAFGNNSKIKKLTIEDSESELTVGASEYSYSGFSDEYGNWIGIYPMFQGVEELYWGRPMKYSNLYSSPIACNPVRKITFGPYVTTIPKYTFFECYSINTIDVKGGIAQWCIFDFSDPYTNPFGSSMAGMEEDNRKVLFNGKELSGAVAVPNDITTIPSHSFQYGCKGITDLTLPAGVTDIADGAFKQLTSLKTIQLSAENTSFKVIENVLYNNDVTKILCFPQMIEGEYVMPSTISEIGDYQFYNCQNLTKVTLSDHIKTINNYAFQNCHKLNSVVIPASVESIGNLVFKDCIELTDVVFGEQSNLTTIGNQAFQNCNKLAEISLPAKLESIGEYGFADCTSLTDVSFEGNSNLQEIKNYAFQNCNKLAEISLPAKLESIGEYAFANCSKLSSISIPASVSRIYDYAFNGCTSITNVVIEDGDTPISLGRGQRKETYDWGDNYYDTGIWGSSPIDSIYIGRNILLTDTNNKYETSGEYRYSIFNGILSKIIIGNKVTSMPGGLFYNCYNIKEVIFDGDIIDWCKISFADKYATPFGGGMAGSAGAILYLQESPLHSQVDIPEGATKIGSYAFYGQRGVSTIIVPTTVTTIEPYAFAGPNVSEVRINATNVINLADTVSFASNTFVYVPDAVVSNYKTATVWSEMSKRILPMGFLTVTVDLIAMNSSPALLPALNALEKVDGEYRISALTNLKIRGTMNGWDILMIRNKMPNLRTLDLTEATILDNDGGYEYYQGQHTKANTISPYCFYKLDNLRKVMLPQNITRISERAFEECRNLTEVLYIPETCDTIGYRAFAYSGLRSIEINKGVKCICNEAFYNCNSLTDVTLVHGLETIEGGAFQNCYSLRSLILPTTLKRIEGYAFQGCSSLKEIDFAEGLNYIGYDAFQGCSNLRDLHMPTTLERIAERAFQSCSGLSEVHVPSMMQEIGDYAFTGCGLKSVYAYTVTPIQINQNTFDYKGVDLFAPENSFYAYYLNTQWSQFADVKEFEALYTNWYTARNTDIEIDLKKPIKNKDDKNPANGIMEPGSGLIFIGDGEQLVKDLILNWNHGSNYPSLIEDGNLSVEELKFLMNVYPGRWYFFSFPFDVKLKDIKHKGKWVFRYYDGAARAANGSGGWKNVDTDVLKAGVGYIFQCNTEGDLELPIEKPNFATNTVAGSSSDKAIELQSFESNNAQDASWNFVGNPNISYYGLDAMKENFTAPVTVWDPDQQTYTAVVPGDDDYNFHPFQAFFVQKPVNSDQMEFLGENRMTYNQANKKDETRMMTRAQSPVNTNHMICNLELSDGKTKDKTRIVFDDEKSAQYESSSDANKFMSLASVPQLYTLDGQKVKYAVNSKPNDNAEICLGVVIPTEGTYTISAPRMDVNMAIKDLETETVHNFVDGAYTFMADPGTYNERFVLCKAAFNYTGISENGIKGIEIQNAGDGLYIDGIADKPVSVYNVKGVRMTTLNVSGNVSLAKGTYIVTMGEKSTKVIVK